MKRTLHLPSITKKYTGTQSLEEKKTGQNKPALC